MLKKLDIYIIKKLLSTFIFSVGILMAIAVVFDIAEKTDYFMRNEVPLKYIAFKYYIYFIPYYANFFSLLLAFLAVLFFTAKLSEKFEFIAMFASGISTGRIMRAYMIGAAILVLAVAILSNSFIPICAKHIHDFEDEYIYIESYRFKEKDIHWQVEPNVFVYLHSFDVYKQSGNKFTLEKFSNGELATKIIADSIVWNKEKNNWLMYNPRTRLLVDGAESFVRLPEKELDIDLKPSDFDMKREFFYTELTTPQLNEAIKKYELRGYPSEMVKVEKYKRFSTPFAIFILTIIGFAMATMQFRGGVGAYIGFGLIISFVYILFQHFVTMVAARGLMPPLLAAWFPNILFGIISFGLLRMVKR